MHPGPKKIILSYLGQQEANRMVLKILQDFNIREAKVLGINLTPAEANYSNWLVRKEYHIEGYLSKLVNPFATNGKINIEELDDKYNINIEGLSPSAIKDTNLYKESYEIVKWHPVDVGLFAKCEKYLKSYIQSYLLNQKGAEFKDIASAPNSLKYGVSYI
jgi:hypothetical protein